MFTMVRSRKYFDILKRLGVTHGVTDRRTRASLLCVTRILVINRLKLFEKLFDIVSSENFARIQILS